jgi:two-component system chemotaxis response regulator CheY
VFYEKKGVIMSKRIMVVDDSATIRQVLSFTLEDAGFEVIEAADGHEALQKLGNEPLDMLITDLNMPKMDGIELIREVRKIPTHKFMPILMLTTESQGSKKQLGKEAGASAWLVKPFKPEQLLSVINMVLS